MKQQSLVFHPHSFFAQHLVLEMQASPHTAASYRDTLRLLPACASDQSKTAPTDLQITDIDAEMAGRFLMFVETARGNSARSRDTRLYSFRLFFECVAIRKPQLLHQRRRILAMPNKRYGRNTVDNLQGSEIAALFAAPDPTTRFGRRDRKLLLLALQTGLRVPELIQLNCSEIVLGPGAHVRCRGMGRKQRVTCSERMLQGNFSNDRWNGREILISLCSQACEAIVSAAMPSSASYENYGIGV
ncbi:MAG: hypothetical protein OXI87_13635 [Albidovulum sp.]|nr:hypothetical protein [Albidovulum sp.]MDE0530597.1 hypothetical protein [Albidovulum sp.]